MKKIRKLKCNQREILELKSEVTDMKNSQEGFKSMQKREPVN
jgi:phage gp16-like protein